MICGTIDRMRLTLTIALLLATLCTTGCVRRTITITTEPPGALVWLNDREVGRTPITVDFLYYGTYDVRLERDGYEPQMTYGVATPPLWDNVPLDFVAEILPMQFHSHVQWHYDLQERDDDRTDLLDRADAIRQQITGE